MKAKNESNREDYLPKVSLSIGDAFPANELRLSDGTTVDLRRTGARWTALYFYPKDDTPTCTRQACNLRDAWPLLEGHGIMVLGISPDNASRHQRFAAKHALPFRLVVDEESSLARSLGIFRMKKFMGRAYEGMHRVTLLLDAHLKLAAVIYPVEASHHHEQILEAAGLTAEK